MEQFDEDIVLISRSLLCSLSSTRRSIAWFHTLLIILNKSKNAPVHNAMPKKSRSFRKLRVVSGLIEHLGMLAKYCSMPGVATSLVIFSVA